MNKKTITGIIIAILLVIVVGIVYFTSNKENGGDNKVLENQTPNKVSSESKSLVVYSQYQRLIIRVA